MFGLFARKRPVCPEPVEPLTLPSLSLATREADPGADQPLLDPEAQVELVCQAVHKLEAVSHLVRRLPELPVGSRQDLLAQLASTSDSLRSLYFLDAIY